MVSKTAEKIKQHTEKIKAQQYEPPRGPCPQCTEEPPMYKLHESRPRKFRYILADIVNKVESLLLRWKCVMCNATFTEYPDFALPYKRYVSDDILRLSGQYLEQYRETYRRLVTAQADKNRTLPTVYEQVLSGREGFLAHSTPWNWMKLLGQLPDVYQAGLELIRSHDPTTQLFRRFVPVDPKNYRSLERKNLLQKAKNMLLLNAEHENLFGHRIFPRFKTLYR